MTAVVHSQSRWQFTRRKFAAVPFFAVLFAAYVYGPTEREILSQQARWKAAIQNDPVLWGAVFVAVDIALIGLSAPVATGLTIICGYLFGRWPAVLLISLGSPVGALLAMLASRYLFHGMVRRSTESRPRLRKWIHAADRGIDAAGWYYLLLLRLTPVIPFVLVNFVMGLTRIRAWAFYCVSLIGMLPATFVFVNAGATARDIKATSDLISLESLLALMLLVFFPVALRAFLPKGKRLMEPIADADGTRSPG